MATRTLVCSHCDGTGVEPFVPSGRSHREEVLAPIRQAHDWQCDCTPDDPCRISIALDGGPSRPESETDPTRCTDCGNPADVCLCEVPTVSQLARRMLDHAAEVRLQAVDLYCPAKAHSGEHNSITVTHWFRRFDVCASCGFVERAA